MEHPVNLESNEALLQRILAQNPGTTREEALEELRFHGWDLESAPSTNPPKPPDKPY